MEEYNLFRSLIQQEWGVVFGDDKISFLEHRLFRFLSLSGCNNFRELYLYIKKNVNPKLKDSIVEAITTSETMWFRDFKQWELIKKSILPEFIDSLRREVKEKVYIWSVACSTGQEPYSMAMLIQEAVKKEPKVNCQQFVILGTDNSKSSLFIASSGRYNQASMSKGMLPGYKEKCFAFSQDIWEIRGDLKKMVFFKHFKLQENYVDLPQFDIIFCKSIFQYYHTDEQKIIYQTIHNKLAHDSYFFTSSTDDMSEVNNLFEPVQSEECFYYKPKQ
ncbi:MAG: hypothetical protein FWG20_02525 [Candidatus Cloacimonetes bacterium]|nr:hypothetical protein [Candidatus Cloacimonadota bacterium]